MTIKTYNDEDEATKTANAYLGLINEQRNKLNTQTAEQAAIEDAQAAQFIANRNAKIQKALSGYQRMMKYLPTLQKDQGRAGLGISESGYIEAAANRNNLLANAMRDYDAQVLAYNKALEDTRKQQQADLDQRELDYYKTLDAEDRAEEATIRKEQRAYDTWVKKNEYLTASSDYEFEDDGSVGAENGGLFKQDENGNYTVMTGKQDENGNYEYTDLYNENGKLTSEGYNVVNGLVATLTNNRYDVSVKDGAWKADDGRKHDVVGAKFYLQSPHISKDGLQVVTKQLVSPSNQFYSALFEQMPANNPFVMGGKVYIKTGRTGSIFEIEPAKEEGRAAFNMLFDLTEE